jgi:hypothetical protein
MVFLTSLDNRSWYLSATVLLLTFYALVINTNQTIRTLSLVYFMMLNFDIADAVQYSLSSLADLSCNEVHRIDILVMLLLSDGYVAFGPAGYRHIWRFE